MSLSYLKHAHFARSLLAASVAMGVNVQAAEYFWVPNAEVSAEANTNRELDSGSAKQGSEAYSASLSALLGVATPRSESAARPRVYFVEYSDQPNAQDVEGGIDFTSTYESPRAGFDMYGTIERRDIYNAELADARFDELDPNNPTSPDTGRIDAVGETRDLLSVRPRFSYQLTQRFDIGLHAAYEKIDYSSNDLTGNEDYDYINFGVFPTWQTTERLQTIIGAYGSKFSTADDASKSNSLGLSVGFNYEWSKVFTAEFSLVGERTEIDDRVPVRFTDEVTSVGGRVMIIRKAEVADLRFELAHLVAPTGGGGMYETDQLQVQYDRRLSERLTLQTAALYYRDRAMSEADTANDRDYANVELGISWNVTRTWYVFGGYRYIRQEYKETGLGAENHTAFLGVGYRGLRRGQ